MTLDPQSLLRLKELGRQLPKEITKPVSLQKENQKINSPRHPIQTEEDPNTLFKELIKASPDGHIPAHLIARLKELEATQLMRIQAHSTPRAKNQNSQDKSIPKRKSIEQKEEELQYTTFARFLSEEE